MSLVKMKGKFHLTFLPFDISIGLGCFVFNFSAPWHQRCFHYTLGSVHKALFFSAVTQQLANQTSSQIQGPEDINFNFPHQLKVAHFACAIPSFCEHGDAKGILATNIHFVFHLGQLMQRPAMLMQILLSASGGFDWGFQLCPFPAAFYPSWSDNMAPGLSFSPSCALFRWNYLYLVRASSPFLCILHDLNFHLFPLSVSVCHLASRITCTPCVHCVILLGGKHVHPSP